MLSTFIAWLIRKKFHRLKCNVTKIFGSSKSSSAKNIFQKGIISYFLFWENNFSWETSLMPNRLISRKSVSVKSKSSTYNQNTQICLNSSQNKDHRKKISSWIIWPQNLLKNIFENQLKPHLYLLQPSLQRVKLWKWLKI